MIKLVLLLYRRPELSRDEFSRYWLETHGPLVCGSLGTLSARRYVQSHRLGPKLSPEATEEGADAADDGPDGVVELWWDSVEAMTAAFGSEDGAAALRTLAEDEANFIDRARTVSFVTEEHDLR